MGLTLPSLRVVVVVEPDQFGISQLYQSRGRVARHVGEGFFFPYLTHDVDTTVKARLTTLTECKDGFTVTERDAAPRGYGDLDAGAEDQSGRSRLLF